MSKSFNLGQSCNNNERINNKSQSRKVPGLDFSNLKHVKDYKDWYAYAKKLEDALTLLRQRIAQLETENEELQDKVEKQALQCE